MIQYLKYLPWFIISLLGIFFTGVGGLLIFSGITGQEWKYVMRGDDLFIAGIPPFILGFLILFVYYKTGKRKLLAGDIDNYVKLLIPGYIFYIGGIIGTFIASISLIQEFFIAPIINIDWIFVLFGMLFGFSICVFIGKCIFKNIHSLNPLFAKNQVGTKKDDFGIFLSIWGFLAVFFGLLNGLVYDMFYSPYIRNGPTWFFLFGILLSILGGLKLFFDYKFLKPSIINLQVENHKKVFSLSYIIRNVGIGLFLHFLIQVYYILGRYTMIRFEDILPTLATLLFSYICITAGKKILNKAKILSQNTESKVI